jgi:Bacterial capsule synthesis protein PGA_cap
MRIVFAGDIMLDWFAGEAIADGGDPFAEFAGVLAAADVRVGNLESVVATVGEKIPRRWTFRAHPRVLPVLARHFDAVSLANNHTGDFGKEAFVEQLELLRGKVGTFGGGRDLKEARAPLVIERRGMRIALLGYNEFKPREFAAGPDTPGVAWSVDEHVLEDIRAARAVHKANLVVIV